MSTPPDTGDGPDSVQIRPARPEDVPALVALLSQVFAFQHDVQPDASRQRRGLDLLLHDAGSLVLIADRLGTAVGTVSVQTLVSTAEGGPVGLLEDLVVDAGTRGRGIGSRLLRAAEAWAAARGLERLQLLAHKGNRAAMDFYASRGWEATELVAMRKS